MKTERSIKNLKPFKKGQSGNPNGRPKKLPGINQLLAEVLGDDTGGVVEAKKILIALSKRALKGDVRAAEIILDRAYGKPKQSVDVGMQLSGEITIGYGKEED